MATVTALVSSAYTLVAADVSTLVLIQCPGGLEHNVPRGIELITAESLPAVTVRGVELAAGETIVSTNIPDLGTGKLYAKSTWGNATGEVLVI